MTKTLYDYCIERDEFRLLVQWDKEKNGDLTARDVSYASHKKVWWQCEFHHLWEAPVYSRTDSGTGCPYCAGKKMLPFSKTLASEYPNLQKEWHPTLNIDISPEDIPPGTHRKVWWICEKGHEWKAQVRSRVNGTGCPICTNRTVVAGENDLSTIHPEIAAQWHPTRNGTRTPQTVADGSSAKVWWQCEKGHEWQATTQSRTSSKTGCPVCAGKLVIPGENDLASSFPDIAAQWHPSRNGLLSPEQVTPYSNKRIWWLCEKGHEFSASVGYRTQNASGCPYCSNRKVLAGFNDLATVHPAIAMQWNQDLNGELTPQMIMPGSHKKVWWQCSVGHTWKAVVYSRTGPQKCGCPVCAGKVKESRQRRYDNILPSLEGVKPNMHIYNKEGSSI